MFLVGQSRCVAVASISMISFSTSFPLHPRATYSYCKLASALLSALSSLAAQDHRSLSR